MILRKSRKKNHLVPGPLLGLLGVMMLAVLTLVLVRGASARRQAKELAGTEAQGRSVEVAEARRRVPSWAIRSSDTTWAWVKTAIIWVRRSSSASAASRR